MDLVGQFLRRLRPELKLDPQSGEISVGLGSGAASAQPAAAEVFSLPGQLAGRGRFRLAIALDEFQQILSFDGRSIEEVLRNAIQRQREVGCVFAGSQPSLMEAMLAPRRPLYKAGPTLFLDRIPAADWRKFIRDQFHRRRRESDDPALDRLLAIAGLIPYDVQRIAHELWNHAELSGTARLGVDDVERVTRELVRSQAAAYERQWEQLAGRQRAVLQALAARGAAEIFSQRISQAFRLGAASSAQKALQSLQRQDILSQYQRRCFFLDPLFEQWIRQGAC